MIQQNHKKHIFIYSHNNENLISKTTYKEFKLHEYFQVIVQETSINLSKENAVPW